MLQFAKKYSQGLIICLILLMISALAFGWNLGSRDLWEDEYQVYDVSYGFSQTGELYKWDWIDDESGKNTNCIEEDASCNYTRAWPHTFWVGGFLSVFGEGVLIARISSVVLGMIAVVLLCIFVYQVTKDKILSLTSSLLLILNYRVIEMFRYVRMYAMLIPLSILFLILSFKLIESKESIKKEIRFYVVWFILIGVLFYVHINSIILTLPIGAFVGVKLFLQQNKKIRYWLLGACSLVIGGILFVTLTNQGVRDQLSFFNERNFQYLSYVLPLFKNTIVGWVIMVIGVIGWLQSPYKKFGLFLTSLSIINLIFFIFLAERYTSFQYISHVVPITTTLTAGILLYGVKRLQLVGSIIVAIALVTISSQNLWENRASVYGEAHKYSDHIEATNLISSNIEDENDYQVIALFPREYYLRELPEISREDIIKVPRRREYRLEDLKDAEDGKKQTFFVFESHKGYHIHEEVVAYLSENYQKVSGAGITNSKVEIFVSN